MSRWIESFNSHESVNSWNNLKEIAFSSRLDDEVAESDVSDVARIRKVINYLDSIFEKIDPEITPFAVLNNIAKHANVCGAELNNYIGNSNSGHLSNANTNLDVLITIFNQLPASNFAITKQEAKNFVTGYTSTFSTNLKRFSNSVDGSLKLVASQVGKLKESIDERRNELNNLTSQLQNTEQTIQKQTAEFNNQFQSSESARAKKFDEVISDYNADADAEFKTLATKAAAILDVLSTLQKNAQDVYDVTINTLQAGAYSGYANEERRKANFFSSLASLFFIVGTAFLVAPEILQFLREDDYTFTFQNAFYRVGTSLILFVPAFYFAKESSRHRANEVINRRRQHILTTLDPYTKLMDPEKAEELKIHVAKTIFSDVKVTNDDDSDYQSLVERLKGFIDKYSKS